MRYFEYRNGEYYCEDVALSEIAKKVGTPFYCYSAQTLIRHIKVFDNAFRNIEHLVCFAVKANSNIAVLNLLANYNAGADIVSGGELFRALKASVPANKIVFAGVGKSADEIREALLAKILLFNVESSQELLLLDSVAGSLGLKAPSAIRVNPNVDAKTHPKISTGLKHNKFGISYERVIEEYKRAKNLKNIEVIGIHEHIGSQVTQIGPFADALEKTMELVVKLKAIDIDIKYINLGGGLGITYKDETPPHPDELASVIEPIIKDSGVTVIFEPGRVIAGNAGVLVTKTLFTKTSSTKEFIIVDAAMNDLARPSLYGSYHSILPIDEKVIDRKKINSDVVGPICESGDFLAQDRMLPHFKQDECMAIMSVGAYGFTMSSNYNSRRKIAEVLVNKDRFEVIRERETYSDLIRGESIPKWRYE
ncbi:MAG: diaminopimelate decarboxylase [Nitrospinota bacterium]